MPAPTRRRPSPSSWAFAAKFRRGSFGWRSQPAIQRIKEAIAEIKAAARKDALLGAEGAVLFLEKVSPALEHADSSSGAIGTAVNSAIDALVPIIATAPADDGTRQAWLERLWEAHAEDQIPYIEGLGDFWGELCVSKALASAWADNLLPTVKMAWSKDPALRGFFHGTSACLSALSHAERHDEILSLLAREPNAIWPYRQWGVKALAAQGKTDEAIAYAETERSLNDSDYVIARLCETILLSDGRAEEAYQRYAIMANQGTSNLATYRAIAKKYPHKGAADILADLVRSFPGEEGKWFATANDLGLYDEAIALANRSPSDPRTLTRAARDFAEKNPSFALQAGLAALRWLVQGYGYEVTGADVWDAYTHTLQAAERLGVAEQTRNDIGALMTSDSPGARFVAQVLGQT
jgi:hypothetical protein